MATKLKKIKLFLKKYGIYILVGFGFIFGIIFAFLGAGKDNFWFKNLKKLMALLNKTQDELANIHKEGQQKEDVVRHDKEEKDQTINQDAVQQQQNNTSELKNDADKINQETKDDPEKMGEAFENTFGIPKGNNP